MKPEIRIHFLRVDSIPEEIVYKTFKPTHNVSSIKGFAVERLKKRLSPDVVVDSKQIIVTCGVTKLRDSKMLVDFVFPSFQTLTVHCPQEAVSYQTDQQPLELDAGLFTIFD